MPFQEKTPLVCLVFHRNECHIISGHSTLGTERETVSSEIRLARCLSASLT
jgi:hypothetical protein